jgi:hypothetical protein
MRPKEKKALRDSTFVFAVPPARQPLDRLPSSPIRPVVFASRRLKYYESRPRGSSSRPTNAPLSFCVSRTGCALFAFHHSRHILCWLRRAAALITQAAALPTALSVGLAQQGIVSKVTVEAYKELPEQPYQARFGFALRKDSVRLSRQVHSSRYAPPMSPIPITTQERRRRMDASGRRALGVVFGLASG